MLQLLEVTLKHCSDAVYTLLLRAAQAPQNRVHGFVD